MAMIVIVKDESSKEQRYLVDVGFGGDGLVQPILLERGSQCRGISCEYHRLTKTVLPGSTNSRESWVLEHMIEGKSEEEWRRAYSFDSDIEFMPADFGVMNYFNYSHPDAFFVPNMVAIKFLLSDEGTGQERINGRITLFNRDVKKRWNGETTPIALLDSEEARIRILEDIWGIELSQDDIKGIENWGSAIK
jgi:arylamine N-acetyltransferase